MKICGNPNTEHILREIRDLLKALDRKILHVIEQNRTERMMLLSQNREGVFKNEHR